MASVTWLLNWHILPTAERKGQCSLDLGYEKAKCIFFWPSWYVYITITNYVTLRDISTYINLHMGVQRVPWRRLELNGRSSNLLITTSAFRLFFCWFFCTLTILRTFHDCTLCQRADITSWPLIYVRTLIITYFPWLRAFFWYIY